MLEAVILDDMDKHNLLDRFAKWQRNNPQVKNIKVHYSLSVINSTMTSVYSMLILFDEQI